VIIKVQHAIGFVRSGKVLAIMILGIDESDITNRRIAQSEHISDLRLRKEKDSSNIFLYL
jgi:hypothetical protein